MIPPFNYNLFQRIYNDLQEIKEDLESKQYQGHEWIDIDEIVSNDHQIKQEEKK